VTKPKSILYLVPQLAISAGGLEVYAQQSWAILREYAAERGLEARCIALLDKGAEGSCVGHPYTEDGLVLGCDGNKLKFVRRAIVCARANPDSLVLVGHIRQSQVAWLLNRLGLIHSYAVLVYGYEAWVKVHFVYRFSVHKAKRIITISNYTAESFRTHNNIPKALVRIIPPSLKEVELETPFYSEQGPGGVLRILSVGRLQKGHELKGYDVLLKAVARTKDLGVQVHLSIVGDGDDRERLQNLMCALRLSGDVTFYGRLSDKKLIDRYKACDVFAMPSRKEGFGIVFIEAMRFGKPCIGGNHGGTPEVIEHGVNGYLVEHGDVNQLAIYLAELAANPRLRAKMGWNGYQKAKNNYTFLHMKSKWFDTLDEMFAR